jgi:hypothetical protein
VQRTDDLRLDNAQRHLQGSEADVPVIGFVLERDPGSDGMARLPVPGFDAIPFLATDDQLLPPDGDPVVRLHERDIVVAGRVEVRDARFSVAEDPERVPRQKVLKAGEPVLLEREPIGLTIPRVPLIYTGFDMGAEQPHRHAHDAVLRHVGEVLHVQAPARCGFAQGEVAFFDVYHPHDSSFDCVPALFLGKLQKVRNRNPSGPAGG